MRSLELRIPPPLVALFIGSAMWGVASLGPSQLLPQFIRHLVAGVVAAAGVAVNVTGMVTFGRAGTTLNPMKPETASSLVSTGIFAVTRNPMYLGALIVLLAWAIYLSSMWAFLGLVAFVLYITRFQIIPEERALAAVFGSTFSEYKKRVPRWL
jgi:protein-S-isoprenylcysteine O-methyltransferase Ste14